MPNQYRDPPTRDRIEYAMRRSQSNNAAAQILGIGLQTYRKYAKLYFDEETGKDLYEKHKNWHGIGIPKHMKFKAGDTILTDILEGNSIPASFSAAKLKALLIKENCIEEKCEACQYKEQRSIDYKVPVILNFRDGNKKNWKLDNLYFLCYNCFFLHIGDIYNAKQIETLEGMTRTLKGDVQEVLQIDDIHMPVLKEVLNPTQANTTVDTGEDLIYRGGPR